MTTRIFVRGLPPSLSEAEFRSHFATKGTVTDIKFIPRRRIGYVGYKTSKEADEAVRYFNKSFIRMSKIGVEISRPVADAPSCVSYPKHDVASSTTRGSEKSVLKSDASLKRKRETKDPEDTTGAARDKKLENMYNSLKSSSRKMIWDNGDLQDEVENAPETASTNNIATSAPGDEEYQPLPSKKKQKSVESNPITPNSHEAALQGIAIEEDVDVDKAKDGGGADADWLRSRSSRLLDLTDDIDIQMTDKPQILETGSEEDKEEDHTREEPVEELSDTSPTEEENTLEESQAGNEAAVETITQHRRLFVRNLPYSVTEEDLREYFTPFGDVEEIHLPVDSKSEKIKGFAYVAMTNSENAVRAFEELNGRAFQGRLLHILPAFPKKESVLDEFALSKLPLKKQKEIKRKSAAASTQFNWNFMYMNADAVVSSVANKLGVDKASLLDPTSSDAAVRQAHAETHVIQATKTYLTQNGVKLDAFETHAKDDRIVLLKNFSYGTTIEDLRSLLSPYGQITRLLVPPPGTIAIAEYKSAPSAKAAFGGLAYRRFKDSVLYLEKGPKGLFGDVSASEPNEVQSKIAKSKVSATDLKASSDVAEATEVTTLFVRNLNFTTTKERLTQTFAPIDGFVSAVVKTKSDPKKPGQTLSMGYGFVEFRTPAAAQSALAAMNGYTLDSHELQLKPSEKGKCSETAGGSGKVRASSGKTKIIIKNLPFEATKRDVQSLFGQYGTLRTVRVPKKFGGRTRGFAFADFTTSREAQNAMESLKHTHLLGRRLVLQFASQDAKNAEEEIEMMNKKVAKQTKVMAMAKLQTDSKKKIELDENGDADGEAYA